MKQDSEKDAGECHQEHLGTAQHREDAQRYECHDGGLDQGACSDSFAVHGPSVEQGMCLRPFRVNPQLLRHFNPRFREELWHEGLQSRVLGH